MSKLINNIFKFFAALAATDGLISLWAKRVKIKAFIISNKTLSAGFVMSFISSLFAPMKATFGWSSTIILITGLSASTFLLLFLLWRKFKEGREIKKTEKTNDSELNHKRMEKIDETLIKAIDCDPVERMKLYSQVLVLARDFQEIKKQQTEEFAKKICGENATQEQKSSLYTIYDKYEPFREKINALLATKATNAIKTRSISKQSIQFLSSITDDDLEILKKQFKYVLHLPHLDISKDLAIPRCEENEKGSKIHDLLLKEGNGLIHLQSYTINFYGNIWVGENFRIVELYGNALISNIDSQESHDLKIVAKKSSGVIKGAIVNPNITEQKPKVTIPVFVCLSAIGEEIFNLLKDEIEPTPIEYLNALVEFWNKNITNFNFELVAKTKIITNNNA